MQYPILLFDLDGTLTDPGVGITSAAQYALKAFGIDVADRSTLYPFIGPPLKDSFMDYFHLSSAEADIAIRHYRDYFARQGWHENEVYPDIENLLSSLQKAGNRLLVATSKPEIFARRILEHFRLARYFDFIGGSTLDGSRSSKSDVIRYVLENGFEGRALMIGDRKFDIAGAQANGLDSVGVLYGYGSREELSEAGATFLAASVTELGGLIASFNRG